ncbi:PREDICTED: transcription factor 24 [Nanorana parkeri]|uniref:transcription factor 24 n=1 Tax=Nanorana parkeri TaxID=125878 RepID=UPI000854126A|nr:PREDICTED: transcription factor 24 [Nanorana parkeri]
MVEKVQRPLVSRLLHVREESPGRSEQDSHISLVRGKLEGSSAGGSQGSGMGGRPAAANAARERNRVQTLRHAFLELQRTLPSVPPDTKLSKLDVLILATTYIAHLTRSLQEEDESSHNHTSTSPSSSSSLSPDLLGSLHNGDGYLHPVKKWPMRSRLYIGATGQFLHQSSGPENQDQNENTPRSDLPILRSHNWQCLDGDDFYCNFRLARSPVCLLMTSAVSSSLLLLDLASSTAEPVLLGLRPPPPLDRCFRDQASFTARPMLQETGLFHRRADASGTRPPPPPTDQRFGDLAFSPARLVLRGPGLLPLSTGA